MVYCKTETNLCPPGPEMWECPTNKGSAAALPRYSSAVCPTVVHRTSAIGQMVLAFMHLVSAYNCGCFNSRIRMGSACRGGVHFSHIRGIITKLRSPSMLLFHWSSNF